MKQAEVVSDLVDEDVACTGVFRRADEGNFCFVRGDGYVGKAGAGIPACEKVHEVCTHLVAEFQYLLAYVPLVQARYGSGERMPHVQAAVVLGVHLLHVRNTQPDSGAAVCEYLVGVRGKVVDGCDQVFTATRLVFGFRRPDDQQVDDCLFVVAH
ncbi:MAG: hypothetical protein OXU72_13985 [Gammaproteobacteria bacterium]|nr:hypothetical protein [Gammaproteobacteria bacterium]